MIGRFREDGGFTALFTRMDVIRVGAAGMLLAGSLILGYVLTSPPSWLFAVSIASLLLTGWPIVWGAIKGLARMKSNVDELVSIAIVATLILGEFNSAAIVSFIMALGGLIEEFTSNRARKAVEAVLRGRPETATVVEGNEEKETPVGEVAAGRIVRIKPGDVIPLDGSVVSGRTSVDESSLTGEPLPAAKSSGDPVYSGTINGEGCVDIRVSCPACDGTLAGIARLIEDAETHQAPVLRVAERYARWFTPAILVMAGVTWLVTGDITRAVAVLIVGCPCAFVLATPTAVVAAMGAAARRGMLIKGGRFLEAAGLVDHVDFDKTGTITEADFEVARVWVFRGAQEDDVLCTAALAETGSEHPIARAVLGHLKARGLSAECGIGDFEAERGRGVRAGDVVVGNRGFMEKHGIALDREILDSAESDLAGGLTALFVAAGGVLVGGISLRDRVRPEAAAVVRNLRELGLTTRMLTGDHEAPARAAAKAAGVEAVLSSMLPGQKQAAIREIQQGGRRVAYVGDGANDGPALAEAMVGVSLASRRNNVALETAHVVLMSGGLGRLPFLITLGRRTRRTICQNLLFFGLAFNAAMLALSALGVLTPVLGALAHNAGSVLVVLNSARLLRARPVQPETATGTADPVVATEQEPESPRFRVGGDRSMMPAAPVS